MRDIVLLPGFMCDADLWSDMVPELGQLGRLHHGNLFEDDSLEAMAQRVLDQVPDRFLVVGFSMGGFVARVMALMAPQRIAGIAFVATSARGYSATETAQRQAKAAAAAGGARATRPSAAAVARGLHPDRERDPVLLQRLRTMQQRLGADVMARQAALVRLDGYAELERIACPALVVACRQDRLRSYEETARMARHLPRVRFEVLEDCGHMAPLERPAELAKLLRDWIEREGL